MLMENVILFVVTVSTILCVFLMDFMAVGVLSCHQYDPIKEIQISRVVQ